MKANKSQSASDKYTQQYLRNVNPPVTKPKQPTPFESYASYVYETTGKNATQEDFDRFMADVRGREQFKRDTAPAPTTEGYEAWARKGSMSPDRENAINQARLEQFLSRAAQKGLSRETAQRLFIQNVSGRGIGS
jgi:hypothetical protein